MKFIRIGNRLINLNAIATIDFTENSVIITLIHSNKEYLEFSGKEAQDLKNYFSNSNIVDVIPAPPRPPLEAR